jgi:integrase
MSSSYDVRIWKTEIYKGVKRTTYYVRWKVAGKPFRKGHTTSALADSFRAELVTSARKGEAFDTDTGLPVAMRRDERSEISWYDFACSFVDMKWPRVAATTRRTHAEALTTVTVAMLSGTRGKPDGKLIRKALTRWGFNAVARNDSGTPGEVTAALRWVRDNTRPVSSLADAEILRPVLDALTVKLDGKAAAPSVVSRKRKIFHSAVGYAVERKLLGENPIPALKWTAPKTVHTIDRRSVVNPIQARTLLEEVKRQKPHLVAFFGCLYYAGLRPEEAVCLSKTDAVLPADDGWGDLLLHRAEPYAGREWTDSGESRDRRQLKQRALGEVRVVPSPPPLTALLRWHIGRFGTAPDGRLFVGERNRSQLPKLTIVRTWQRARQAVFTNEVAASPLARTPYDLRHAAVSTQLNAGVSPKTVADRAGHSLEILLRIYAQCMDGQDATVRRLVETALGY